MAHTAVPLNQLILPRIKKICNGVKAQLWQSNKDLDVEMGPLHEESVSHKQALKEKYKKIKSGTIFSPKSKGEHNEFPWGQRWFKVKIPAPLKGEQGKRYMRWSAAGEYNVYIDGVPWAGLDVAHNEVVLPNKACTLMIDCGLWQTGIWSPLGDWQRPVDGFAFNYAKLAVRNSEAWEVFHDLSVLIDWVEYFYKKFDIIHSNGPGYNQPLGKVPASFRRMVKRLGDASDAYESKGLKELGLELKKIYRELPADSNIIKSSFVGHAHIDLVWLWPEKATYKKGIHTFSTMLRLMDKYPEVTFTMSQPPLYYHIAEHEPKQAKQIQKRIKEGRWEFTGGLEVESDTQLPVGEGLARALMYGQQRIEAVRGSKSNTVWIPDVFGYSQCLPQIFKLGEIKNFYTTKILWSSLTQFPHNSFIWKSPDGSEILTHLALSGYNCEVKVGECIDMAEEYKQSDVHDEGLLAAGYGDGGGGLTEAHCERARRLSDLAGVPKSGWNTVEGFFDGLEKVKEDLPQYRGELYLEYHRGVQTTQSDLKYYFRASERALQCREAIRVITGKKAVGEEAWLRYIFAQFHDAIPGTSINTVYKELNEELKNIAVDQGLATVKDWGTSRKPQLCVINPLAIPKLAVIECGFAKNKNSILTNDSGQLIPTQITGSGVHKKVIAQVALEALESQELNWVSSSDTLMKNESGDLEASSTYLSNGSVNASFTKNGELEKLNIDGVDILLDHSAHFMIHTDSPANYAAWDIDHQATWLSSIATKGMGLKVIECGAVRAVLKGSSAIGEKSTLEVEYTLEANSPYLQIKANVDWNEKEKLLRYQLNTGYRGEIARYGAPFGSVDRSQKEGLPSDEAMWEVPASRWASAVDGKGNGLAIITEAKYGFSVKNGVMGLSLLRSSKAPDPTADMGKHAIKFALGLHSDESTLEWLSTAAAAETLFTPAICVQGGKKQSTPFSLSSTGSLVPSWVLPSETGSGYVIRLHEVAGATEEIEITFNHEVNSFAVVNFFENEIKEGCKLKNIGGNTWSISVDPYKIVSLLVRDKQ
jgi:alpha-mannosidase